MATWTLAQLKTRVREAADMVYSEFVEDTELTGYISNSYAKFYDMVTKAYEDHYLEDPVSFTITSGNTYDLDSDFYKLVGVDFQEGTQWVEVRSFNFNERNSNAQGFALGVYHPILRYRLTGNKLRFVPVDQATGTYRYWYIPLYTPLAVDADTIDGFNGWEEWVVLDAAIKCLIKEETSVKDLIAERDRIEKAIKESAKNRDTGESQTITDVYAGGYNGSYGRY